jgi:hypothetical protein
MRLIHLNNQGKTPIVLDHGQQGFKEAYGFRAASTAVLKNPLDTVGVDCPTFWLNPRLISVDVVTLTNLNPEHAAGSLVNDLFKFQHGLYYYPMSDAARRLNQNWSNLSESYLDFFLLKPPPNAGWRQFEMRLMWSDSSSTSLLTDSIYLQ